MSILSGGGYSGQGRPGCYTVLQSPPAGQDLADARLRATLWDLVTDERVAIEAVGRAVDADLAEPAIRAHALGPDHVLDLATAVAAHAFAPATMVDAEADEPARRMAVRSALLMARPTMR